MRLTGFLLFIAGVVLAAWYAARPLSDDMLARDGAGAPTAMERIVAWGGAAGFPFAIGVLLMAACGVIARRAERRAAPTAGAGDAAGSDTGQMLRALDQAVATLPEGDPQACAAELHERLDLLLEDMIPEFLEQRQHCVAEMGLARYAEMSGSFASAERSLARAWSALTDEVWHEVPPCLATAKRAMAEAVRVGTAGPRD